MIIQSSQIAMNSQHQRTQFESEHESLHLWHNKGNEKDAKAAAQGLIFKSDKFSFSTETSTVGQQTHVGQSVTGKAGEITNDMDPEEDIQHGWKLKLLQRLVESLSGKKIKLFKASDLQPKGETIPTVSPEQMTAPAGEQTPPTETETVGWGMHYHYEHSYHEEEQTSFNAAGIVKTADGKEIELSISLNMSRSFTSHESIDILAGDALKDPLVINYAGTAAQLDQTDLQFDIDLDGELDQLNFVAPGSGFLALDRNGDNLINDGSELFGPTSGHGFSELAEFDLDNNHWIDENDDVYAKLRIWSRDSDGNSELVALGQKGIGAIYLDHIATPFSLNNSQNEQLGQVQSSGIFLYESGQAGTIQQLDLVV
ncbi:MAG: hypothetical protein U9R69_05140 [Thermodesulfobacteriota bacterium]|nr:hypothetical protein [Thermodesulfobacteriota bacterium]